MPEVTASAKQAIDKLSLEELTIEVTKKNLSVYTNANHAYLCARLEVVKAQSEDEYRTKALKIAKGANFRSTISVCIAIAALVVAVLTYIYK